MAASGRVLYTIRLRIFFVLYIFDFQHFQISSSNKSPVLHTNKIIVTHNNVKFIPVRISLKRRHRVRVHNKQNPRNLVNVNITKGYSRSNSSLINNKTVVISDLPYFQ